jgi:hypothetical protein
MKKYNLIIGFICLLVAFSCEKEVTLELPEFKEKIVVDGRIETGELPFVILTRSRDLYAPTDFSTLENSFVHDAVITVSNGSQSVVLTELCTSDLDEELYPIVAEALGISVEVLMQLNFCAYTTFNTAIVGEIGKQYDLSIQVEGKEFTSTTQIVAQPIIDSVYFKLNGTLDAQGFAWSRLIDDASVFNAYYLQMKRIHKNSQGEQADQQFLDAFNPVVDDAFFNGLEFDFGLANMGSYKDDDIAPEFKGYFQTGDTVVIRVSGIDYDVFSFMRIKYVQVNNEGNPFASPANAPTNIKGGALGVWAGYSPRYDTLICFPQ